MKSKTSRNIWIPLWFAIAIIIGIFIGAKYDQLGHSGKIIGATKIDAVLNFINKSYVDSVDIDQVIEGSLPEIVKQLDPHSVYYSADEMKSVNEDLEGHFSGIGVVSTVFKDTITVTGVVSGGPSEAAGIQQWDRIVYFNDSLLVGRKFTDEEILNILKGEKGTVAKLGIKRQNRPDIINIEVTRSEVSQKSIPSYFMQTEDIGYIKIATFSYNTFNEFISALSDIKSKGCSSIVIDLRENAGGVLDVAVAMINEFLNKGDLIVYSEGYQFRRMDNYATGTGSAQKDNVVVLIDEISASASEIFAGAIQDHDRGLIVGRRSFGKGLVQNQRNFSDGSAVWLTVARYYTPSGRSIQRKYERGKYDEYKMEAYNRFFKGNYVNEDSTMNLKPFKTDAGRIVYGGHGIMPDIFIPRDTIGINSYYHSLLKSNLISEYSMFYADYHKEKLAKFKTVQELYKYLRLQPLVDNLVSYADNKGIRRRPYYIEESRQLLHNNMVASIAFLFFGNDGFYYVQTYNDEVIDKAVSLIYNGFASPESVKMREYEVLLPATQNNKSNK